MRKTKGATAPPSTTGLQTRFAPVVAAFSRSRRVDLGRSKGFGSGTLLVNGKIFAMMTSKGELVVKLSKARVDDLVNGG